MTPPTALGGPQFLSLEASQLWAHIDDQAHRKEAKGAEQTQHGSSRVWVRGSPQMGLEERVEPRGPCSESRTALPELAGCLPRRRRQRPGSDHPATGVGAGHVCPTTQTRQWLQKGRTAHPVGAHWLEQLGREVDIRTGSPSILAEPRGTRGHRLQPRHS